MRFKCKLCLGAKFRLGTVKSVESLVRFLCGARLEPNVNKKLNRIDSDAIDGVENVAEKN